MLTTGLREFKEDSENATSTVDESLIMNKKRQKYNI